MVLLYTPVVFCGGVCYTCAHISLTHSCMKELIEKVLEEERERAARGEASTAIAVLERLLGEVADNS